METAKIAESVLLDEKFKTSLIKALVGFVVSRKDYIEQIQKEATGVVREFLDGEKNKILEDAREVIKVKSKNIFENNFQSQVDRQITEIIEQFTPKYIRNLVIEHFNDVVRGKINDTQVSFRLGSLFDD